uniref:Reverse transcriptase domain-containing protein n=1 Tax=Tanacetum cinerariifolium TaxID=118510 RepID=A0A6L2M7B8_TANCI|nr:reverse transcriptase domain-containing protein [Tanacetum cinerariifolium]
MEMEGIAMDFVTKLLRTSNGHDTIWVIIDRLTKSTHFLPMREDYKKDRLARLYLNEIVARHGVTISIISDHDSRCQKMLLDGDVNENVPLYYHMFDNFQIQFGREKFCLVTGLKFGIEYWVDYDDKDEPIPFRRWVFPSSLDGKHITGRNVEELIKSKSFSKLDNDDGCVPAERLISDEIEVVPGWWVSSRAYFGGRVSEAE